MKYATCLSVVCLLICVPFELSRNLVFGWVYYLLDVIPQIRPNAALLAIGIASWLGVVALIHHLGRWFRRQASDSNEAIASWSLRSSLCLASLIVVMFCAGIAAAGITHQTAWLIRSPNPIWVSKIDRGYFDTDVEMIRYQLMELDRGINHYSSRRGKLPFGGHQDDQEPDSLWSRMYEKLPVVGGEEVRQSWPAEISTYMFSPAKSFRDPRKPWDDESNRSFFQGVFPDLLNPSLENAPQRDEQGYGLSHFEANQNIVGLSNEDFRSGTSQTMMIGEVRSAFEPWGKPATHRDVNPGLNRHPRGFGGPPSRDTVIFLFADGSVRAVNDTIDPTVLEAMSKP